MKLEQVATPALVLDRARLTRNTRAMSERAREHGIRLRPHMKTAKCSQVAALATADGFSGITVSTLAEAEYFAAAGYTDITYAVCITPDKVARAARLRDAHPELQLTLFTDSAAVVRAADERAHHAGARFPVLIEIDSGEHRTGVSWSGDELLDIAAALDLAQALDLAGVATHGGHAYAQADRTAIEAVAEDERVAVVAAAERLRAAGHPCATVSAGSTPTAVCAADFSDLTEIRPGVYMFLDLAQYSMGVCDWRHIAISVLATVISHQPRHGRLIVDAGALALSKDRSANARLPDAGYGWVLDVSGSERVGDLRVAVADQEHGYVEGAEIPFDRLPVGSRVRILPNHACITAAMHERYLVVDADADQPDQVVATWSRSRGW